MIGVFTIAIALASSALAGKRGLAWPWYNKSLDPGVLNNGQGQVVAIYDWETYPPPSTNGAGGLGFIGMQRCRNCDSSPINQLAQRQREQGWATVFSLNEPDYPGTANTVSPADAASWYITNINPLAIKKAFPAITSSQSAGQGLDWLAQFLNACGGRCYGDYINLHWYGNNFAEFQSHIQNAHNKFPSYSVVITEFALNGASQSAQVAFFKQAFAWLDSQSWVTLYFPFVATSPALLSANDGGAAGGVGTGSCLYTNAGGPSAVGNLM
ncbi:glycoside hydrolase family 128 protein, partial [Cylindrobasidium torrendii FP15055 ss-10]